MSHGAKTLRGVKSRRSRYIPPYRLKLFSVVPYDDMESYSDGASVNGLDGGKNGSHVYAIQWTSAYADRTSYTGRKSYDDMESYADGEALNGLNGGTGFTSGYVNKDN